VNYSQEYLIKTNLTLKHEAPFIFVSLSAWRNSKATHSHTKSIWDLGTCGLRWNCDRAIVCLAVS